MQQSINVEMENASIERGNAMETMTVAMAQMKRIVKVIFIYSFYLTSMKLNGKTKFLRANERSWLLVPWTENHLSSFKCGFLNIFSRQNLLRSLSRLLFLVRWNKFGAKKMSEKPHYIRLLRWFNFSQSLNRENDRKAFDGVSILLVPWTKSHLSSLKSGFLNIFSRQNLLGCL